MIPLAVIRPRPGWERTADAARTLGLAVIGAPLFEVKPVPWTAPDAGEVDALLIGSANAMAFAGAALHPLSHLPAYAVGARTAAAARAAGLSVVHTGTGDLQSIAPAIERGHRRLLRLVGETHGAFEPPAHAQAIVRVVYDVFALPIGAEFAAALARPAVVALHSAGAARHFAAECDRLGIDRAHLSLAALAPAVAQAAGAGWGRVEWPAAPSHRALLALAAELCQTGERI